MPPLSVTNLVHDFTLRLIAATELAAAKRGKAIIDSVFSALAAGTDSHLGKAAKKRADRDRGQVVAALTQQFLSTIEQPVRGHVRAMLERELAGGSAASTHVRTGERSHSFAEASTFAPAPAQARRRTRRARPNPRLPPPLDPKQIERDQEFARLRALLRPVAVETIAPLPEPVVVTPPVQPQRPASPGDVLRALEKEIQNAVPSLGTLGPERCTAQIAAWTGLVRGLRDRLPPEVSATMRPAFRIFLEHLTQLRVEMEAHVVDALEPNWKAPDWDAYVEVNRARVEQRKPALPIDIVHLHHRAMLRALVLPHRRNVPQYAAAVINAAAEALHPEDSLLQSAIRRHRSAQQSQAPAEPTISPPTPTSASVSPVAETITEPLGKGAPEVPEQAPGQAHAPSAPLTAENEFDSAWSK
ncbi:MAG TPA: hypothetical protein VF550_19955 [Polyangia bacterium]